MYTVTKRIEVSGAHCLNLSYESKCRNLHGHNWIIECTLKSKNLNGDGMVMDFTHIKNIVSKLDHANVNEVLGGELNPTAENIAKWLCSHIPLCVKVSVQESEGNIATYEKDDD